MREERESLTIHVHWCKKFNKKHAQNAQTRMVCLKSMQKDGQKDLPVYYVSNINKNVFKLHEKEKTT